MIRPFVTCPVCGATRVPCRPTPKGFVLLQHREPRGVYLRGHYCMTKAHPVPAALVLAWVDAEKRRLGEVVAARRAEVDDAQARLAKAKADETEGVAALAKIAARAQKASADAAWETEVSRG